MIVGRLLEMKAVLTDLRARLFEYDPPALLPPSRSIVELPIQQAGEKQRHALAEQVRVRSEVCREIAFNVSCGVADGGNQFTAERFRGVVATK